jgi:outer membrane protein assembly factor BamD (BamD/ComL family)
MCLAVARTWSTVVRASALAWAWSAVARLRPWPAFGILALLCALRAPVPAGAATLEWKALPDRERITLRLNPSDGMAGRADRIAPNAVLVPFTSMPPGLLVNDTPEGAKLFQKTMAMGRALAIVTQTPEFGFMVSGQNPSELVIDFFPNPLGARWKRTAPATVTEIAPDRDLQPLSPPDAVTEVLRTDPGGQGTQSRSLAEAVGRADNGAGTPPAAAQTPAGAPAALLPPAAPPSPPAPVVLQPAAPPPFVAPVVSQPAAPPSSVASVVSQPAGPLAAPPPVVSAAPPYVVPPPAAPSAPVPTAGASAPGAPVLPGTPEHALRATRMGDAQPPALPRRSELPGPDGNAAPRAGAGGAGEQAPSAGRPFELYLPPVPQPEAAPSPVQAQTAQPSAQAQTAQPSAQAQTAQPFAQAQTAQIPASAQVQGVASAQNPIPAVPVQSQGGQPGAQAPQTQLPGVGIPSRGNVYSGSINAGGPEAVAAALAQENAANAQAAPPAGPGRPEISDPADMPPVSAPQPAVYQPAVAQPQTAQPAAPAPAGAPPMSAPQPAVSQPAAPAAQAQGAQTQGAQAADGDAQVIVYTDDQGNPVEPPPVYSVVHPQIVEHMKEGKFEEALPAIDGLLERATLNHEQRANLLHARSETLFALHKDAVPEHFQELYDAAVKAVNYDPDSRINGTEYLRLGYMNLRMNNPAEAEANFSMVRRRFPDMDNVALTYYYWGDYHYGRNELQKAADQFQHMIREFPNSRYTREASIGLARSLYRMGYYDQAWSVVDYINRRWERFYIQYPPFLNMTADTAYRLGNREEALKNYWLYVNLEPFGKEADIIMTRIGDIYAGKNEKKAAHEIYLESALRYPDKDGGLVAMMRMAEEGIHDNPSVAEMFTVFDGPFNLSPQEVYKNIIEKHPNSSLVPVAEMKLALWHLWNKDYDKTLELLGDFLKKHPDHELAPRAREIAQQAFAVLAAEGAMDGRATMLRELWERYPIVRADPEAMNPESRLALALSYRSQGKPDEALRLVEPFFLGDMLPGYSETALSMVLGIYLQYEQWNAIKEVAKRVEFWNLPEENRRQLDYAAALAEENLGETDAAAELWQRLYDSGALPPAQHAYAAFFLTMGAERGRRLEQAYHLGREALSGLEEQMQRSPDPADAAKIRTLLASLMDVTESAGRLRESLAYADRYLNSLPEGDPERLAVRYRVARIHKSQGDAEAWKTMLTEIAAESPDSVYGKLAASELKAAAIAEDAARYSPTGRL